MHPCDVISQLTCEFAKYKVVKWWKVLEKSQNVRYTDTITRHEVYTRAHWPAQAHAYEVCEQIMNSRGPSHSSGSRGGGLPFSLSTSISVSPISLLPFSSPERVTDPSNVYDRQTYICIPSFIKIPFNAFGKCFYPKCIQSIYLYYSNAMIFGFLTQHTTKSATRT